MPAVALASPDDWVQRALRDLRRMLDSVSRSLAKGGLTEFGAAEAQTRRRAILKSIQDLEKQLPKTLLDGVKAAAKRGARSEVQIAGETLEIEAAVDPRILKQAREFAAEAVRNVGDSLRRKLNQAVVGAVGGAYTREQFEGKILDAFDGAALEGRVERIARTELGRAFNAQAAANDKILAATPGVDLIKRWVRSGKSPDRARPDHDAIDGQERELDDDFDVGGGATAETPPGGGAHRAAAPLDARLPADHTVNCGCRYVRVPREEAVQPYIAKAPRTPAAAAEVSAGAA